MSDTHFLYVTYIRTTPEKLWEALTKPEFTRQYWFGAHQETEWKEGSPWKLVLDDGRVADSGDILEIDPPKRLVLKWQNELRPEVKADGYTRCSITLEPSGDTVKLTIAHEADHPHKHIANVSNGWPAVLSSLKSLIETGHALDRASTVGPRR
jgi:uncharacterized protein YndB with AHSA1/START domain